jgi:hypothetical protein
MAEFGGYPLLDDGFRSSRLLAAAACVRWQRATSAGMDTSSWEPRAMLDPAVALAVRGLDLRLDIEWIPLSDEDGSAVADALVVICSSVPEWTDLMRMPLRFGSPPPGWGSISASAFAWPQHIWLARRAFATPAGLAEQVLHEISHQWLYLIEEMAPLQAEDADLRVVLPSGTSDRTVSELLGALHVCLNLRRLWKAIPVDDDIRALRLDHLEMYIAGCRTTLRDVEHVLTVDGRELAARMDEGADLR